VSGAGREAVAGGLRAGAARVDVTNTDKGPVNDRLFVKALVLESGDVRVALVTVDAVAIGGIGPIGNDYLPQVRNRLEKELGIRPSNLLVNASHCHGIVCTDVAERTVRAVSEAARSLVPVRVGAGTGREDRVMQNRRLRMKDGSEVDVRHAYAMPPDAEVVAVGPVDPEIGVLRLDRENGRTLAVVYNFACHPIQGVPSGGNTADMTGFASRVIEDNLDDGAVALFVQGCAGDINPAFYKDPDRPKDAEPLGNLLGLSTLKALRGVRTRDDARLSVVGETVRLPRADFAARIRTLEAQQTRLLDSLQGTTLNLKTFLPLAVKYGLSADFPSYYSHAYLHEKAMGRDDLTRLDAENRANLRAYVRNVEIMEQLTRVRTNLALLKRHQAEKVASGETTIEAQLGGLRVGDFVLVTFPAELTVQHGLDLKSRSPYPLTFVAGYTNGYLFYAPTDDQLRNPGAAQEDCDCLLAPGWQALFEAAADRLLKQL
jgi:hypothetical protein